MMLKHILMLDKSGVEMSRNEQIERHSFCESLSRTGREYKVVSLADMDIYDNVLHINGVSVKEGDVIWNQTSPSEPFYKESMQALCLTHTNIGSRPKFLNSPEAILNFNSKRLPSYLGIGSSKCITMSLNVARKHALLLLSQGDIVIKSIHGFGGCDVFICSNEDQCINAIDIILNKNGIVLIESFIENECNHELSIDKRVYMCKGSILFMADRVNKRGLTCNYTQGASVVDGAALNQDQTKKIQVISKFMKYNNIFYAGVDMIGNTVTEINIESPGCIRPYVRLGMDNPVDKMLDILSQ